MKFKGNPFSASAYQNGTKRTENFREVGAVLIALEWINQVLDVLGQERVKVGVVFWLPKAQAQATHLVLKEADGTPMEETKAVFVQKKLLALAERVMVKEADQKRVEVESARYDWYRRAHKQMMDPGSR